MTTYLEALRDVARHLPAGLADTTLWRDVFRGCYAHFNLLARLLVNLCFPLTFPLLAWFYLKDEKLSADQNDRARQKLLLRHQPVRLLANNDSSSK